MPSQGLKSYGTYYTASTTNGITAYINLSKKCKDIQMVKSGSNMTTETLTYEYGYVNNDNHTINKNALVRIQNGNDVETIAYDNYMNSLPVSITKNNITTNLTWEGMKLKSYGNISYDYDYLGRRIKKVINNTKTYKYNYDIRGNMVSEEITENNVTTIIRYLYDVNNNVYGLIYNGNIYYYVKNILGEILYIINDSGYIEVEYNYDAFGNILSISGNMATTLGNNNHIVYKSYYMDFENDLYYLKSRYYNPSWGRFISSDKIDPSVASGLNLYAYCLNNPVMCDDPEGTFVWIILLVAALVAASTLTGCASNNKDLEYNLVTPENEKKDGYINYELSYVTVDGITAPSIKIYDSYKITKRSKKKEILKHIINSNEGKEYGLSIDDINYYLDEWNVHNFAHEHPNKAADKTGQTVEEATKSAADVDLNTNDKYSSLYKKWGRIIELIY